MMGLNIVKRKSGKEGTSTANNTQIVRRSAEGAKKLFPKQCLICKYNEAIKIE